jgi:hypothetical protein
MILGHGGGLTTLSGSRGVGHSFFYLDDISWNKAGAWSHATGWRSPHMRVLSGGLEVPAHARVMPNGGSGVAPVHWVSSDSVFLHFVSSSFVGGGSCMAMTLSMRRCPPLCSPCSNGSPPQLRYKHVCGCWVEAAACVYLP